MDTLTCDNGTMLDDVGMLLLEYFDTPVKEKHLRHNLRRAISYHITKGREYYTFRLHGDNRLFVRFVWYKQNTEIYSIDFVT